MTDRAVFVDTVALVALCVKSDAWHEWARLTESRLSSEHAPLVTSDWVLAEFLDSIARDSDLRAAGARIVERLHLSSRVAVVEATREDWHAAFDLYRSRADKGWSLVDCSSILICQSRGIRRVFTRDRHFEQAGMECLL